MNFVGAFQMSIEYMERELRVTLDLSIFGFARIGWPARHQEP
jgi:hypothetical protein